jgi:hypothetical protein
MPCVFSADENDTNEKVEAEEEVTSGVTKINMDGDVEGDKKKPRRRAKKKEVKEIELETKEKMQTDPPSVPIHELFPTSINLIKKKKFYLTFGWISKFFKILFIN